MPAFDSLLTASEIEQVIDYVIFLSMRGETELALIEEASISDEKDPNALSDDDRQGGRQRRLQQVEAGPDAGGSIRRRPRTPSSPREHPAGARPVPGANDRKAGMRRLPRPAGRGRRAQLRQPGRLQRGRLRRQSQRAAGAERTWPVCPARRRRLKTLWNAEARRLGQPAPAGQSEPRRLQGGRRPLDIYWRIAKGINGAQMPAHYPSPLDDKKVWDLVNFVLALPYEPELLERRPARASGHAGRLEPASP